MEKTNLVPAAVSQLCLESYFVRITSKSKIIYWIIIGSIATSLTVLPFIFVDVSVQARGYFQSDIERQTIVAPVSGKVVYSRLMNGSSLNAGDTLLILDLESIKARENYLTKRITEVKASIHDLEILTDSSSLLQADPAMIFNDRYKAELEDLRSRIMMHRQVYLKKKTEHERNQVLFRQNIIPEIEYENSLFMVNSEKVNLSQVLISQLAIWQHDLVSRRNELHMFLADLEESREQINNRIIIAATAGEIVRSNDIQPGSMVSTGERIAEISPQGDLLATCFISPDDIGLIHKGQKVRIQVDAFNYNEWGLLDGEITEISDDMIIENGSSAYFRVQCKPDKTWLKLKNGYRADARKGMSLNARIFVIRRSLFNLLFDKADKWFNPYNNKEK